MIIALMSTLPLDSFTVLFVPTVEPGAASFQINSDPYLHSPHSWDGTPFDPPNVATAT
jgi:hypothetical protein